MTVPSRRTGSERTKMPAAKRTSSKVAATLAKAAARIPGVETGIACAGTALESQTFTVGKKAFLFLGPKDARLKLGGSVEEARRLAADVPDVLRVGKGGWIALRVDATAAALDAKRLERWVQESYQLMAGTSAGSGRATGPK